jgi:hypothetical protein
MSPYHKNTHDELAKLLFITDNNAAPDPEHEWEMATRHNSPYAECYYVMADAAMAAGYRKPRTITTTRELDALPVGSVVLDQFGLSLHKNAFTGWCASNGATNIPTDMLEQEALPATVLFEPEATA